MEGKTWPDRDVVTREYIWDLRYLFRTLLAYVVYFRILIALPRRQLLGLGNGCLSGRPDRWFKGS
jgi:hypothetical protein